MKDQTATLCQSRKSSCRAIGAFAAAAVVASLCLADSAQACGGLFCSSATPVNQAAERIIFAFDKEAGEVNTVVEIRYEGPADRFAWLLPVPGTPDVGVSSSAVLDRLQAQTNPTYTVRNDWPNEGSGCGRGFAGGGGQAASAGIPAPQAAAPVDLEGGQVEVLDSGNVGPYNYETISVREGDADEADAAVQWLEDNDYDLGALGADVLRPYLQGGMNLLAVRLSKESDAGAIRPLMLRYDSERPMIPIRPTAVAANAEMPVMVFVLGEGRAAPTNYRSLVLNEALLDWFNPNTSYNAVVEAAANEVEDDSGLMGHGFVTELAEPTDRRALAENVYPERQGQVLEFRQTADNQTDDGLITLALRSFTDFNSPFLGFGGPFGSPGAGGRVLLDGVAEVVSRHVPLPKGVRQADFLRAPECYLREPDSEQFYCAGQPSPEQPVDLTNFDRRAFLEDIEALVIEPLEQTAELFNQHAYVTRLYTTLSPEEMTLDPEFDLNPDLEEVSERHSLTLAYQQGCFGDTSGPWLAELQGQTVAGEGRQWPFVLGEESAAGIPVNLQVLSFTSSGPLAVEVDNSSIIAQAVGSGPGGPAAGAGGSSSTAPRWVSGGDSSGGCSLGQARAAGSGPAGIGILGALALLGFAGARRRGSAQR